MLIGCVFPSAIKRCMFSKSNDADFVLGSGLAHQLIWQTCRPVVLDRYAIDPALAAGVALTTITDVVGFLAILGLAALVLV